MRVPGHFCKIISDVIMGQDQVCSAVRIVKKRKTQIKVLDGAANRLAERKEDVLVISGSI